MKLKEVTCKITLHATGYGHAFLKSLDWKCAYCDKQDPEHPGSVDEA